MQRAAQNWRKVVAESGGDAFSTLLTRYLSPRHRDDPGHGCAFASLSGDAARCGKPVREAFAEGLESLIDILSGLVGGRTKAAQPAGGPPLSISTIGAGREGGALLRSSSKPGTA
jgi:TetR/AcrR family transcriptional regulator, transcriptional repressor for nem operon